ncbi:sugar phosphate isomerase/epimerase family protein [Flexivirga sp.]|uniref:sugar phosphate isomerase/epimerase family protein n=1 Tax=Flexivirga sp. TaxID=1962927 RepID=UPI003F7E6A06
MTSRDAWTERIGLCSITFRRLSPTALLAIAADAGIRRIEWGSDVHAPADRPDVLDEVRHRTLDAGMTVASYGTYWRPGAQTDPSIEQLVEAAARLGAPRIRVWAGAHGSAESSPAQREQVVRALRHAAEVGAAHDILIGLEFHGGTLTDTVESTAWLLREVDHPNLATYWQPRVGDPAAEAVAGLRTLADDVCAVHVFSWWPQIERLPLTDRAPLWRQVLALLDDTCRPRDLLLEFVPDDDPAVLSQEVATLRSWLVEPR